MEHHLAAAGGVDRVEHGVGVGILEQVGEGSGLDGGEDELVLRIAGQDDDLSVRADLTYLARGLDAALIRGQSTPLQRQDQVHQGDVGHLLGDAGNGGPGVAGLAHDLDFGPCAEVVAQALAHDVVVVDDKDGDGSGFGAVLRSLR